MTAARKAWVESTIRQMELAGFEPTDVLTNAFERYITGEITFHQLCSIMRDEAE